jgi:hypothetical protein
MPTVRRITLFKIPLESDQQKLLSLYKSMQTKALKVPFQSTLPPQRQITNLITRTANRTSSQSKQAQHNKISERKDTR